MRIILRLKPMMQKESYDFVVECYRELLDREPGHEELQHHVNLLWSGLSKLELVLGIMQSEEALRLYYR